MTQVSQSGVLLTRLEVCWPPEPGMEMKTVKTVSFRSQTIASPKAYVSVEADTLFFSCFALRMTDTYWFSCSRTRVKPNKVQFIGLD